MYSKDDLTSKDASTLAGIATQLGADFQETDSKESIIYAILDKQAEVEGNKNPLGTKKKRTRIVKKDSDRVYTVKGKEGENFDVKNNKPTGEQPQLFKDEPVADKNDSEKAPQNASPQSMEELLASFPKHRGRKSKAELAAIAEMQAKAAAATAAVEEKKPRATKRTKKAAVAEPEAPVAESNVQDNANAMPPFMQADSQEEPAVPEAADMKGEEVAPENIEALKEAMQKKKKESQRAAGRRVGRRPGRRHRLHYRGGHTHRRPWRDAQLRHVRQSHHPAGCPTADPTAPTEPPAARREV